jgi:hypothetical protein
VLVRHSLLKLVCCALLLVTRLVSAQARTAPQAAVPLDPYTSIFDAFKTHDIVALGEGDHGNEQGHAFRLALIRDPRFPAAVNDIVVEWGNARYQDLMDRFIHGEDISGESLRHVWQDTTQPFATFDGPVPEEFFRAVRDVNKSLPRDRQIRVLLGDPPVDWTRVTAQDRSEWNKWMAQRDSYPAALIRKEVVAKDRRGLVVYGDMHFQRKNIDFNYESYDDLRTRSIVNVLEDGTPSVKVFSITTNTATDLQTLQSDIGSWPKPALAMIRGTALGAADFGVYHGVRQRVTVRDGAFVPIPRDQWRSFKMEDQFDAILYLGKPSDMTHRKLSPTLCRDSDYINMRLARLALAGLPDSAGTRLKEYCATVIGK